MQVRDDSWPAGNTQTGGHTSDYKSDGRFWLGKSHFYLLAKFGKDILIDGGDVPPKLNSKQHLLAAEFYFLFQFLYVSFYGIVTCTIIQHFSQMTHWTIHQTEFDILISMSEEPTQMHLNWQNCTSDIWAS